MISRELFKDKTLANQIDSEPLRELSRRIERRIEAKRRFPESTYRLQFHAGFTFRDAEAIVPFLAELGITHCYASPYLKARPGSMHGYDIVDFSRLNPEIGSVEDHESFIRTLQDHGMGHILDTVPNHMAVASHENAWWNDVLENGPNGFQGETFDIAWEASTRLSLKNKVLLPVLGEPYGDALESGEIRLVLEKGEFAVSIGERRFPVSVRSLGTLLDLETIDPERSHGPNSSAFGELEALVDALSRPADHLENRDEMRTEKIREQNPLKIRLAELIEREPAVREFVDRRLAEINGKPGEPRSFDKLDEFLERQYYRLAYWRVAAEEINYRRFFDVTDLGALRMEREEVFEAVHQFVLRLTASGRIDGLRIDHPDGLYDPRRYFLRLQEQFVVACAHEEFAADPARFGGDWDQTKRELLESLRGGNRASWPLDTRRPLYAIAEKILGADEALIEDWAIYGTSGYDFMNVVNAAFIETSNEEKFSRLYSDFIDDRADFPEIVYRKKKMILAAILASELRMLAQQFDRLAQKSRRSRDFTFETLRSALLDVIACFPVYRSYIDDEEGVHQTDREHVETAVLRASERNPLAEKRVWDFTRAMLLLEYPDTFNQADRAEQRRFVGKFQQVTAPATAKGIEDTAFYIYNRLLSLNEVGGDPARFGISLDRFHEYFSHRREKWPLALSALSTHDTKRSEDVRARLNVLSEIPREWSERVQAWSRMNRPLKISADAPEPNEEYLLYQTLIGAWPLGEMEAGEAKTFRERIQAYMTKAMREAKRRTSWLDPNPDHENLVLSFVADLLDERKSFEFLADFKTFQRRIAQCGLFNSLSQTVLKLALPGVPDTYQGTEIWDFSLVDPDNRRPVDYDRRKRMLADLKEIDSANPDRRARFAEDLTATKEDGRIKLYVHHRLLNVRRERPGFLSEGDYIPIKAEGERSDQLIAFLRADEQSYAIVVVPRFFSKLDLKEGQAPLGDSTWRETRISPPIECGDVIFQDFFTGRLLNPNRDETGVWIAAADLFRHFPAAVLIGEKKQGE